MSYLFNARWAVLETLDSLILFASTSSDSDSENHDSNKKKTAGCAILHPLEMNKVKKR